MDDQSVMKFEHTREKEASAPNAASYRKFLAGNRTMFTKAFWENGPRPAAPSPVQPSIQSLLPGVQNHRN